MAGRRRTAKTSGTTKSKKSTKEHVCLRCPSTCCHDLALLVPRPRTKADVEHLKWHLHYDTVHVAVRNHRWYVVVKGRCMYLDENDLCTIYERRPRRCRDHKPPHCERYGAWYHTLLTTPEELDAHLAKEKRRRARCRP